MSDIREDFRLYRKLFDKHVPDSDMYASTGLELSIMASLYHPRKCRKAKDNRYDVSLQTRVCPRCGNFINGVSDRHCSNCGQRVLRDGEEI